MDLESSINPCSECNSKSINLYHEINDKPEHFKIWLKCEQCGKTSKFSHKTLLDCIKQWNKNKKGN